MFSQLIQLFYCLFILNFQELTIEQLKNMGGLMVQACMKSNPLTIEKLTTIRSGTLLDDKDSKVRENTLQCYRKINQKSLVTVLYGLYVRKNGCGKCISVRIICRSRCVERMKVKTFLLTNFYDKTCSGRFTAIF